MMLLRIAPTILAFESFDAVRVLKFSRLMDKRGSKTATLVWTSQQTAIMYKLVGRRVPQLTRRGSFKTCAQAMPALRVLCLHGYLQNTEVHLCAAISQATAEQLQ